MNSNNSQNNKQTRQNTSCERSNVNLGKIVIGTGGEQKIMNCNRAVIDMETSSGLFSTMSIDLISKAINNHISHHDHYNCAIEINISTKIDDGIIFYGLFQLVFIENGRGYLS